MVGKKEVEASLSSPVSDAVKASFSSKDHPLLMVKSLSKSYRKKLVLRDVNFEVASRDIFGVIGMSGSGKTTMFQLMSGMMKPESGDVLVKSSLIFPLNGKKHPDYISVFRNVSNIKRHFGFASQMPSFYEHLTVEENILMYGALYGMKKKKVKENMSRLLHLVDLSSEKDTVAAELSGGMQRRLDIACALIHDPKVLFLDEPTSDLDPVMRKQIWALIKEINTKGTTIVLASHILEEVENLCTKVAILHDRRVLGYGTLKELKRLFKRDRQVKVELEKGNYDELIAKLKKVKELERVVKKDNMLVVFVPMDDAVIRKVIRAVESCKDRLVSLDIADATLNEIFEALTKKEGIKG
ncbi:ABC transporter ATP-binding protein [Candidatus Woesearchaeota archaeon]|nr:ABC transporter ATP-binding protein [Candidatus Woesearchaeota archaeon]